MRKVAIAMLAALSAAWVFIDGSDGADKIRISVTNFNMAFARRGWQ
ncbi:MAG TPA: hypothetical protein VK355_11090 [Candidatus Binatia bacterium]|nr:hypothetical protein [Candidatus Binatia bacterium]